MLSRINIGSRQSTLALAQTKLFVERARKRFPGIVTKITPVLTNGDRDQTRPLYEMGGKYVFIKELEIELLKGNIEVAIHSLKDIPHPLNDEFILPAMIEREDPRDAFLCHKYGHPSELPKGAKIGTSSLRRRFQLLKMNPDCEIVPIRGNIQSRIEKLERGEYDAIVLAHAGLRRTKLEHLVKHLFTIEEMVPAVGQGIIAVESKFEDVNLVDCLNELDCIPTRTIATCERNFLAKMGGDCQSPLGGHAEYLEDGKSLRFTGYYHSQTSGKDYFEQAKGNPEEAEEIGTLVAGRILRCLSETEKYQLRSNQSLDF